MPNEAPRVAGAEGLLAAYEASSTRPFQTVKINLVSAAQEGGIAYTINDGDVVMINRQPARPVHVMGLVHKPGQYDMPPNADLHLLDAVAMAGGVSSILADRILILRRVPGHDELIRIESSIRKAKQGAVDDVLLAPGDVVSVEETPTTFLWDVIRNVVRFGVGGRVALF
jgi:polysaccharide export outer membrane protein